jgi:acyl-CoA thioesterase-1
LIMQSALYGFIRVNLFISLLFLGATQLQAAENRILVLGDSISAGYGMSLDQSWVALMNTQLNTAGRDTLVVNASISGETSSGALRRLPALLDQHRPTLVIIELGGNDGLRGFPIPQLRDNLLQMVKLSQQAGSVVLVLPMDIPPNYGSRYREGFKESFSVVTAATGAELGTFPLDGVATDPGLMQADGIHPTASAQPKLLDNILPSVISVLDGL